mgnify:CR=1 FL=1
MTVGQNFTVVQTVKNIGVVDALATTVTANDPDTSDTLTFSIIGGVDAGLFSIDPVTGELTFDVAPDFESPTDNDGDNVYEVTVQASDGLNVEVVNGLKQGDKVVQRPPREIS